MLDNTNFKQQAISTLQLIAAANEPAKRGTVATHEHYVPLCKYHNRAVARGLIRLLEDSEVRLECRTTRMYVLLSVSREDYTKACELLKEYEKSNVDTCPKSFSRDYDAAILIGFVTIFCAGIITSFPVGLNGFAPIVVLINGVSIAVVAERWNRNDRYQIGKHFSLGDIMRVMTLVAINIAIWRLVF